jgi:hypothetical protein
MIDETAGMSERKVPKRGVRSSVMLTLNLNPYFLPKSPVKRISDLGTILRITMSGFFGRSKRKSMNVTDLVDKWVEAVAGMCLAHDKDTYDAHDSRADELLTPLLAAPIAQVREFYFALLEKMKTDTRVPFLVWISFEAWGEAVVKNAPDEGVKRLKRKLASDIADLVEVPVAQQMPEAIKRALMWRDEDTLKEVKAALENGAKPKIVGRQSCLFLECKKPGKNQKKVSVMI